MTEQQFIDLCDRLRATKPTPLADIDAAIAEFYSLPDNGAGGNLHSVLDDNNLEDESIDWCIEHARREGDRRAVALGRLLRSMPLAARVRLGHVQCPCGCLDEYRA